MLSSKTPIVFVASLFMMGCISMGPSTLSVEAMSVQPPSLMIATKAPQTAYIVMDSAKVPDDLPVLVSGRDQGGRLTSARTFVARDLKAVFDNYFESVVVVPSASQVEASGVRIDVRIDRVEVLTGPPRVNGAQTVVAGAAGLTWGLALKTPGRDDYLYSFAGQSFGQASAAPEHVFRSMFESAIADMLKGYTDKKIHAHITALGAEAPVSKTKI